MLDFDTGLAIFLAFSHKLRLLGLEKLSIIKSWLGLENWGNQVSVSKTGVIKSGLSLAQEIGVGNHQGGC